MKLSILTAALIVSLLFAIFMTSCKKETATNNAETDISTDTNFITETAAESTPVSPDTEAESEDTAPVVSPNENLRVPLENEKAVDMIEFQYKKATEIIDWVKNGSLNADINDPIAMEDGSIYFPIIDTVARPELDGRSICTFDDLSAYIKGVFARAIAADLVDMAKEHYADVDGILCKEATYTDTEPDVMPPQDEPDNSEEQPQKPKVVLTEFFLSKFTDSMFRYTAKVTYEKQFDEVAENPGDINAAESNIEYFDFIFENTGSGWYWTEFPALP